MEAMEVDEDWSNDPDPADPLDLSIILNSPVFWTSIEIWNYLLEMSKEWSHRVDIANKNEADYIEVTQDLQHGLQVIGNTDVKSVLNELFNDLKFGQKAKEQKKTEKYCSDHKLSNLLRFVRNFTQHCRENMSKQVFQKYFPNTSKNKQHFLQYLVEKLPKLLLYVWNEENSLKLHEKLHPLCFEFIQMLRNSIDKSSKENRLCGITTKIHGQKVVLDIIKCEYHLYERFHGTVVKIKTEADVSFVEVSRDHLQEITKFKINTPQTIHQYNILFGGHKIRENAALENVVFIREINDLQDIVRNLRDTGDFTEIETTYLLREYIMETRTVSVNGVIIPLKYYETCTLEALDDLKFNSWILLLTDKPLPILNKSKVNDLIVPDTDINVFKRIIESDKQIHILTFNTADFRTLMLNSIHYQLSRTKQISIYILAADVYNTEPGSSLATNLNNYLSESNMDQILLENMFSGCYPHVTILLNNIESLPAGYFLNFLCDVKNLKNIRVIATSPICPSEVDRKLVQEIKLLIMSTNGTNGANLNVAA